MEMSLNTVLMLLHFIKKMSQTFNLRVWQNCAYTFYCRKHEGQCVMELNKKVAKQPVDANTHSLINPDLFSSVAKAFSN